LTGWVTCYDGFHLGVIALFLLHALSTDLLDISESGTSSQIKQAINSGGDYLGRSVLTLAAVSNPDPAVISALVKDGARVNARPQGWTLLITAVYSNSNPSCGPCSPCGGASPRLRSDAGNTAYVYAQDKRLAGTEALRKVGRNVMNSRRARRFPHCVIANRSLYDMTPRRLRFLSTIGRARKPYLVNSVTASERVSSGDSVTTCSVMILPMRASDLF